MDDRFMKERPVFPLLISMALPMVISMLVNSLYNIVDSYFVARISEDAMAALSLVFPIQNLINAVTIGFGIGVNAVIAYHLGANELERADRAASQGLTLSLIHGLVLAAGCIFLMPRFLPLCRRFAGKNGYFRYFRNSLFEKRLFRNYITKRIFATKTTVFISGGNQDGGKTPESAR